MLPGLVSVVLAIQHGNLLGIPQTYMTPPPVGQVVVATVNGQPIHASDVESLLWQWRGGEATQELISSMLVSQDAKKLGVTVTDAEVQSALKDQLEAMQKSVPTGSTLDEVLQQDGFTPSRLYVRKRAELLVDKILAKGFKANDFVKVSTMIFRPKDEGAASVADAIDRAQKAYQRLQRGDQWAVVLADTTTNPDMIKAHGLLGWRQISAFPGLTQDELKALHDGQVTKPVQTANGMQIFRLEARGASASATELSELKAVYTQGARADYVKRVRASAKIDRLWPPQ
jgi:parvulin-like peptidyl-prolyl isomerase